jgi:hypothetical protein
MNTTKQMKTEELLQSLQGKNFLYIYQPFKDEPYDEDENPDPEYTEFIMKEGKGYTLTNGKLEEFDEGFDTLEELLSFHRIDMKDCKKMFDISNKLPA